MGCKAFYEDRSQQNHRPQIAELARKACELLAQQSEFLQKEWRNLSHEQISEYTVRHEQIVNLILAISRDGDGS
jgi:cytochrome c-type biogenesis protein CcmH/NrfG